MYGRFKCKLTNNYFYETKLTIALFNYFLEPDLGAGFFVAAPDLFAVPGVLFF